jgi:hypothetical protein
MIKKILILTSVILASCLAVFVFFHVVNGEKRNESGYVVVTGNIAIPKNSKILLTVEYMHINRCDKIPLTGWRLLKEVVVEPLGFRLKFQMPPFLPTASQNVVGDRTSLVKIAYSIPGYISQDKIFATYRNKIDIGTHEPVANTPENQESYKKLTTLCEAKSIKEAISLLKNISIHKTSVFFPTYVAAQAILALRQGDLNYLTRLKEIVPVNDRFWPTYCGYLQEPPFSFRSFSQLDGIGPFDEREYSLSQIVEIGFGLTSLPFNECNKALLLQGYETTLQTAPSHYSSIFANLPIDIKTLTAKKFNSSTIGSDKEIVDYSANMQDMIRAMASVGPRNIGNLKAREVLQTILEKGLPNSFKLKKDSFSCSHSFHGNVILENFYIEPQYKFDTLILLCTHYDSFSGNIADPGANNGLSGVLALLHLIRDELFMDWCVSNRIGLSFHFYDGETAGEPGTREEYFLGSKHYGFNHRNEVKNLKFVLCLDMIGISFLYTRVYNTTDEKLTEQVLAIAKEMGAELGAPLQIGDDHSIYNLLDVPSTLLIQYEYAHYHSKDDSLDKLNPYAILSASSLVRNVILSKLIAKDS